MAGCSSEICSTQVFCSFIKTNHLRFIQMTCCICNKFSSMIQKKGVILPNDKLTESHSVLTSQGLAKRSQHFNARSCNIVGHNMLHVWPPCCGMLQHVGWCWIKFENGQIFRATFECCMILYSFGHVHATLLRLGMRVRSTSCVPGAWGIWTLTCCVENNENVACVWPARSTHVATSCNNVARCCVEMLRAFGQALIYRRQFKLSERRKPSKRH